MNCCPHCEAADNLFNESLAAGDLKDYQKNGPAKQTQLMIDTLKKLGVSGLSLLDIGGGVGAIQHELIKAGVSAATDVDASAAYIEASRREAARQGHAERITYHKGDFVAMAADIAPADIVTLDRVVCCYPDMPALVGLSSAHAQRFYGLVFPVDRWYARIGGQIINLFQIIRRDNFRFFVHPTEKVDAVIRQNGLQPHLHKKGLFWQVMIYTRPE